MVFVDTGPLYALVVQSDINHTRAMAWHSSHATKLITTDYVLDELLTLLRGRGHADAAIATGRRLFSGALAQIEWVTPEDVRKAWTVFRDFHDKAWSFTDCVSRVVMERLKVKTAFAVDDHFRQFGTVTVVP
jgi:hypothetical protein